MSNAIYLLLFIATAVLFSYYLWHPRLLPRAAQPGRSVSSGTERISDPILCRQLIECKQSRVSKPNRLAIQKARAPPNQRLRNVFNIDNGFTSTDPVFVDKFVRDASQRIMMGSNEWLKLGLMLLDTSRQWVSIGFTTGNWKNGQCNSMLPSPPASRCSGKLDITSLVQALTLKATLATVLKGEAVDCPNDFEMLHLAQQINRGWIQSKMKTWAGDDISGIEFQNNDQLRATLNSLFPQVDHEQNPLNFLLPSFETMWRVVLRTMLELRFRSGRDHPEWGKAIETFCRDPTKAKFEKRPTLRADLPIMAVPKDDFRLNRGVEPSVRDIIMEALRLYPPTRRIYRAYECEDTMAKYGPGKLCEVGAVGRTLSKITAADIEACHLRSDIWGPGAARFDPSRWMNITPDQKSSFMPFGYGVCECPAKAVFGPWMIAILVGALLSALDDDGWNLWCADDRVTSCLASKERLMMERDAYDELKILRS